MDPYNLLVLDPATELRFRGPFREVSTTTLRLTNPTDERICFKVKTTAPKKYCVRPTCGEVAPGSSLTIQVLLQPAANGDPVDQQQHKHKFMIQSVVVDRDEVIDHDTIWSNVDQSTVMVAKLRCVLEVGGERGDSDEVTTTQQRQLHQQQQQEQHFAADSISPVYPSAPPPTPQSQPPSDEQRLLLDEVRKYREENAALRRENASLRDEPTTAVSRRAVKSSSAAATQFGARTTQIGEPPALFGDASLTSIFVMSLILVACGVLIAKTIF